MDFFEHEYRSQGYWLSAEERIEEGMCPYCGEYLSPEQICNCIYDNDWVDDDYDDHEKRIEDYSPYVIK